MGKKRKKRIPENVISLTSARYEKLLLILLEAWDASQEGQNVFWDLGPGERPQKISGEFLHVAKKEKIPLMIKKGSKSLCLIFPERTKKETAFRVRGKDGEVLAEGKKE